MSSTAVRRPRSVDTLSSLDTITASLVARQSRSDDDSLSVADQIDAMHEWCEKQTPPVIVGGVYEERDVSGRRPLEKRHGLKSAVDDVESGASQMILTAYFDRFVRSVATRAEVVQRVERAGGVVMTIDAGRTSDATAADKLSGTLLAAIAEFYADQSGEKTMQSKQRNIDKGVPPFPRITPAYVRRADGTLEQHATNGPLVRQACARRARGESFTAIARWLNEQGVRNERGDLLSPSGVESMLTSKLLIGEIHFGSFKPNLHAIDEPVCDRATWRKMQSMRAKRGRYGKSERLLARQDVLVCATCDSRMSVHSTTSNGKRYAYYQCGDRLCSAPAVVAAAAAEDFVRDEAIKLSANVVGRASAKVDVESARVEREEAEQKLGSAIKTLVGLEGEAASREVLDELQAERDAAIAKHERLLSLTRSDRTVRTARDWDALTLDERRAVIRAVVARAVVAPGRGSGRIVVEGRLA